VLDGVVCVVDAVFGQKVGVLTERDTVHIHIANDASKWRKTTLMTALARV
jgi:hypothetical protein